MTASSFLDACGFIPASTGTGDFVVSTAVTGYQTPASAGAVNTTVYSYRAESSDKTQWEIGYGAYTVSSTTLARTTVTANNLGTTAKISFSAAPNVFITAATADLINAALLTTGTLPVARINGGTSVQYVRGDGAYASILNTVTNSLGADVALNNTANYFDGPSCAQGTSGTWFASGTVCILDTAGAANVLIKLWDGTTVIASAQALLTSASSHFTVALSGVLATPAANIRISCKDISSTSGKILFNDSSNSKDSTLTVLRIA